MKAICGTIKARDNLRNEMHFEVQRKTRANIFRDKTKYTRKVKHKHHELEY